MRFCFRIRASAWRMASSVAGGRTTSAKVRRGATVSTSWRRPKKRSRSESLIGREGRFEAVDKLGLGRIDPAPRGVGGEPFPAAHLWVRDTAPGAARPLGAGCVAHRRGRIEIALDGPGMHQLARPLPYRAQTAK